jgi:hypothetical protein
MIELPHRAQERERAAVRTTSYAQGHEYLHQLLRAKRRREK